MSIDLGKITPLLFMVILYSPLLLTVTDTSLTKEVIENRSKIKFPSSEECEIFRIDDCFKKMDSWFNDIYKPRDLLIKLQTQIDFSIFSVSDKVHVGSSNWLFYRSTMDIQKVASERISQRKFEELLVEFENLDTFLAEKDIQLVVLLIPLKDTIYPEYLPSSVPNLPHDSRYQALRNWLSKHDSIITVDAHEFLMKRKLQARAFHKTDFHWNDPSGFLFSKKIVNKLWHLQSGQSNLLWSHDLTTRVETFSGGQANFLPLLTSPSEEGLFLDISWELSKGQHNYNPAIGPWDYTYDGTREPRGRLGGVVVFGDSFFDAMHRSGIDTYFSFVYRARRNSAKAEEVYSNIPPDTQYLIYEFIESSIFGHSVEGLSVPMQNEETSKGVSN